MKAREQMAQRHAAIAGTMIERVRLSLTHGRRRLSAANAARWLDIASKLERLSLGAPVDESVVTSVTIHIAPFADEPEPGQ